LNAKEASGHQLILNILRVTQCV